MTRPQPESDIYDVEALARWIAAEHPEMSELLDLVIKGSACRQNEVIRLPIAEVKTEPQEIDECVVQLCTFLEKHLGESIRVLVSTASLCLPSHRNRWADGVPMGSGSVSARAEAREGETMPPKSDPRKPAVEAPPSTESAPQTTGPDDEGLVNPDPPPPPPPSR